jgi:hypothetical protein
MDGCGRDARHRYDRHRRNGVAANALMEMEMEYLWQRLQEPSTWSALAAFFGAVGTSLLATGQTHDAALYIEAIAAGCSAVGVFVKERQ